MTELFDPYLRWLGIRDLQRPPNHYRLLGVELFEPDLEVISGAADRQMAHVRSFQTGRYAELSQRILNELAAARVCLLNPDRKITYDVELRKKIAIKSDAAEPPIASQAIVAVQAGVKPLVAKISQPALLASATAEFASFGDVAYVPAVRRSRAVKKGQYLRVLPILGLLVTAAVVAVVLWNARSVDRVAVQIDRSKPVAKELLPKAQNSNKPRFLAPETEKPTLTTSRPKEGPSRSIVHEVAPERPADKIKPIIEVVKTTPKNEPENDGSSGLVTTGNNNEEPDESAKEASAVKLEIDAIEPLSAPTDNRLPVPDKEAQAAALATIKGLYKPEFTSRKPDVRAIFAKKLLSQAQDSSDDPVAVYVLYDRAMTLASTIGDVEVALQAAESRSKLYRLDALETQSATLAILSRTAKTQQASIALGDKAAALTEEAIAADRYDMAYRFNSLAISAAKKSKDLGLVNRAQNRSRSIKYLEAEFSKIELSLTRLKTVRNDPEANLIVGRFVALVKGDFKHGIEYLRKSDNPSLKTVADEESRNPGDPMGQIAIADKWWQIANSDDRDFSKGVTKVHAATWYNRALPKLTGLARTEVEMRLRQIEVSNKQNDRRSISTSIAGTSWDIKWMPNPDARTSHGREGPRYPRMTFNADGTCQNGVLKAKWIEHDGYIIVQYPSHPEWLQRYRMMDTVLQCEHYDPPETRETVGSGTRLPD